jgi:hypothetical protein
MTVPRVGLYESANPGLSDSIPSGLARPTEKASVSFRIPPKTAKNQLGSSLFSVELQLLRINALTDRLAKLFGIGKLAPGYIKYGLLTQACGAWVV